MKRKFTCMILALVLVISLLPLGAIHTQAARKSLMVFSFSYKHGVS